MKSLRSIAASAIAATMVLIPLSASADFIVTLEGTDCAGEFGIPFKTCKIPLEYDKNQSPVIIKYEYDDGSFEGWEINTSLFPSIDGTEFLIVFDDAEGTSGTWTYTQGLDDPVVTFFVAKGGQIGFNLFSNTGALNTDTWFTPMNDNGKNAGLSHLTFYDTGTPGQVPLPGTLLLLGAGLLGIGMVRRRR